MVAVQTEKKKRRLITFAQVLDRVPYSRRQIYRFQERGEFPKSHHAKTGKKVLFFEDEIDAWMERL